MTPNELADRYVALWNEPDPAKRRAEIAALWSEDGVQLLKPPQEIREAAATLAMTPTLQARGHAELEARVARAYEEFVAPGEIVFARAGDDADRVQDVVKFRWVVARRDGSPTGGAGLEVLVLAPDGRIQANYQFIE